jgi:hypothetical protein
MMPQHTRDFKHDDIVEALLAHAHERHDVVGAADEAKAHAAVLEAEGHRILLGVAVKRVCKASVREGRVWAKEETIGWM